MKKNNSLQFRNRLVQTIRNENPIAVLIEESENGDYTYEAKLSNGKKVQFFVPKKDTYLSRERMNTQEYSKFLTRFLK